MERNTLVWLGVFAALALLEMSGEALQNSTLIFMSKPLLMPLLIVWLIRRTPGVQRFFRNTFIAGLISATAGDILLMFTGGEYDALFFLLGLGAFLGTHLCYLGGFFSEVSLKNGYLARQPLWIVPFALFLAGFLYWLWPDVPEGLRQPVALYAVVISTMVLSVVNMYGRLWPEVFHGLLFGALLFLLSDCLIALHKFGHPFPGSRVAIMATYLTGQWLIVRGVSERLRRVPVKPGRVD